MALGTRSVSFVPGSARFSSALCLFIICFILVRQFLCVFFVLFFQFTVDFDLSAFLLVSSLTGLNSFLTDKPGGPPGVHTEGMLLEDELSVLDLAGSVCVPEFQGSAKSNI